MELVSFCCPLWTQFFIHHSLLHSPLHKACSCPFGVGRISRLSELACRCRGRFCKAEYWHAPEFLDALEALRVKVGRPLILNSGHRCAQWNAFVGGAPASMHKTLAADISLAGHDRQALLRSARETGFTGLGFGRSFLHVDRRKRPAHWYYHGSRTLWET